MVTIEHTLRYALDRAVDGVTLALKMRPRDALGQVVSRARIETTPSASTHVEALDESGNHVDHLTIRGPVGAVEVRAESVVVLDEAARRRRRDAFVSARPPLQKRHRSSALMTSGHVVIEAAVERNGRAGATDPRVLGLAEQCAAVALDLPSLLSALVARTSRALVYDTSASRPGMPLSEALHRGRGVCQDYAHLAAGALRALGIEARYVAGYVPSGPLGDGGLHAWIAVRAGDHGWIHVDPTRASLDCDHYVIVAEGMSYWDTTPVMGHTIGEAHVSRSASVRVARTDQR